MDEIHTPDLKQAVSHLKAGDLEAAQKILISIIKTNPNNEAAWYALSFTLRERTQKIYALKRALQINPDFQAAKISLAKLQGQTSGDKSQLEKGEPELAQDFSTVKSLLDSGKKERALEMLRSMLKESPEQPLGWYLLSFAEPTLRAQRSALRQAVRIDPAFEKARVRLSALDSTQEIAEQRPRRSIVPPREPISQPQPPPRKVSSSMISILKYFFKRVIVIALTICIGTYITVSIANKTKDVDQSMVYQIRESIEWMEENDYFADIPENEKEGATYKLRLQLQEELGILTPQRYRNLRYTYNALTFSWGKAVISMAGITPGTTRVGLHKVRDVILQHFPNTLLIIGTANLITFLLGIPLSLRLASRKQGQWIDRFMTMLAPISSIPSWVHGALLIGVFAIQLRLLPASGKYDILPAETWLENFIIVGKHMILPVTAVLLGMFFQMVYTWRTYLMIFSEEDYVELAKAKGIPQRKLERKHILHPAMPFMLTGFAMSLVGFWQMATAVERFFYWPGLGYLYLSALPQYLEDIFFPGDLGIILSIVVIFAYMLGFTVLILDMIYAWIDPRVRLGVGDTPSVPSSSKVPRFRGFSDRKRRMKPTQKIPLGKRLRIISSRIRVSWRNTNVWFQRTMREVLRYPSAVIGLVLITILIAGSLYAVIALPFAEIGEEWRNVELTGRFEVPKNVPAVWVNWFRARDFPTTVQRSSLDGSIQKTVVEKEDGYPEIVLSTTLDYPYQEFPQDLVLFIEAEYDQKAPHLLLTWITPDGREIFPKSPAVKSKVTYYFSEYLPLRGYLRKNVHWENWFVTTGAHQTPAFYVLFAEPESDIELALPGTYQLQISALTFEENNDVDVELLMLGKVYGWAGTDYLRRDLLVPLFWGLPLALAFGLVGATLTTLIAMHLAAAGVWFGGWVDNLVQRLTEINMILPILAIGVLIYFLYDIKLWVILVIVIAFNIFGSPTKSFRAAFLQIREDPYIEAAKAYGASNARIIVTYMVPRIFPTLIPQLVALIPSMVFLEATLGILGVFDPRYPTWGRVIFEAIEERALWAGSQYWVLEPIGLLLLTGVAFALLGFALERVLNPRLQSK